MTTNQQFLSSSAMYGHRSAQKPAHSRHGHAQKNPRPCGCTGPVALVDVIAAGGHLQVGPAARLVDPLQHSSVANPDTHVFHARPSLGELGVVGDEPAPVDDRQDGISG